MFVDWAGLGIDIADAKTGEVKAHPVFVSALGLSQHIFAKTYENEQLPNWLGGHVDALEFYGAVPEVAVPDNPKTGVEKACRYEPILNPSYAELASHYGIAVLPARVRKPRDKAKVENAVLQVERWVLAPLSDRTFFSLEEANQAIAEKLAELNDKLMKGPNLSRRQLFEMEDLPAMRPLPAGRYRFAEWKRCKVAPDYHVEVHGNLYSVPFGLVGKSVDVRIGVGTIEVFLGGKRVASHLRALTRRNPTTEPSHMPAGHRAQAEWTPERMVRWAGTIGPNTASFVEALLKGKLHPEHGFRMCFGIMSLSKKYEDNRMEAACLKARILGALSYTSVKSILAKNLDSVPEQPSLLPLPSHDNIRGGDYYSGGSSCAN
jgi:transposase